MLLVLSMALFYLLGQDDWTRCNMTFGHMMPVLASHDTDGIINSVPLNLLVQDDENEMQLDFSVIWQC